MKLTKTVRSLSKILDLAMRTEKRIVKYSLLGARKLGLPENPGESPEAILLIVVYEEYKKRHSSNLPVLL